MIQNFIKSFLGFSFIGILLSSLIGLFAGINGFLTGLVISLCCFVPQFMVISILTISRFLHQKMSLGRLVLLQLVKITGIATLMWIGLELLGTKLVWWVFISTTLVYAKSVLLFFAFPVKVRRVVV